MEFSPISFVERIERFVRQSIKWESGKISVSSHISRVDRVMDMPVEWWTYLYFISNAHIAKFNCQLWDFSCYSKRTLTTNQFIASFNWQRQRVIFIGIKWCVGWAFFLLILRYLDRIRSVKWFDYNRILRIDKTKKKYDYTQLTLSVKRKPLIWCINTVVGQKEHWIIGSIDVKIKEFDSIDLYKHTHSSVYATKMVITARRCTHANHYFNQASYCWSYNIYWAEQSYEIKSNPIESSKYTVELNKHQSTQEINKKPSQMCVSVCAPI